MFCFVYHAVLLVLVQFLDELQHEYRTIVEYRTSLETLATVSQQVQETYRCSKVESNNRRQQPNERTAKASIGSVKNAAASKKVKTVGAVMFYQVEVSGIGDDKVLLLMCITLFVCY